MGSIPTAQTAKPPTKPMGTLFQHELFKNDDGKVMRRWNTGPLKSDPSYSVHRDGSLRHSNPQFRGSKKAKKRFMAMISKALTLPLPQDFKAVPEDVTLELGDRLLDAVDGWITYPFDIPLTLAQIKRQTIRIIAAAKFVLPSMDKEAA